MLQTFTGILGVMGEWKLEQIKHYRKQDPEYPKRLLNISGAPKNLYVLGRLPEEDRLSVAVIGARDCSEYGKYVARELGTVLGSSKIAVVSGMARGIDGISQEAALNAGGCSFAVLGCGVDVCYPEANRQLYERLKISGGIISEYPSGSPALACHFPPRNRIVSGLADVVVVIEARIKSGTLITVDMALEQGREVYVVPGRVTDRLSDGCNSLIKQGAGILLSPEGFLRELLEGEIGKAARSLAGERRRRKKRTERVRGEEGEMEAESEKEGDWERGEERETEREKGEDGEMETEGEACAGLSPELKEVFGALDFMPQTPEQIRIRLPEEYQDKQIITLLMRLCVKGLAVQVSPGRFVCVKS